MQQHIYNMVRHSCHTCREQVYCEHPLNSEKNEVAEIGKCLKIKDWKYMEE